MQFKFVEIARFFKFSFFITFDSGEGPGSERFSIFFNIYMLNMVSEYSWLVSKTLAELLSCERFHKSAIIQRDLSLSQAFCLLWQNDKTGDVAGRQRPTAMSHTACAAVLLDLYVLEKVDFEKEIKQWMDRRRQVISVQVGRKVIKSTYTPTLLLTENRSTEIHKLIIGFRKTYSFGTTQPFFSPDLTRNFDFGTALIQTEFWLS